MCSMQVPIPWTGTSWLRRVCNKLFVAARREMVQMVASVAGPTVVARRSPSIICTGALRHAMPRAKPSQQQQPAVSLRGARPPRRSFDWPRAQASGRQALGTSSSSVGKFPPRMKSSWSRFSHRLAVRLVRPSPPYTMKRNFGSLNLAALDLHRPADGTDCSLEDRCLAMGPGARDGSMDAASEHSSDENVGFPLERFQCPTTIPLSFDDEARRKEDMDADLPELSVPVRISYTVTPTHTNESGCDVWTSELLHPLSSETLQHPVEINALRRLSLKVMLSNLSTSTTSSTSSSTSSSSTASSSSTSATASVASNKPSFTYPGVNDRTKTALLPIRHPSLQSV